MKKEYRVTRMAGFKESLEKAASTLEDQMEKTIDFADTTYMVHGDVAAKMASQEEDRECAEKLAELVVDAALGFSEEGEKGLGK